MSMEELGRKIAMERNRKFWEMFLRSTRDAPSAILTEDCPRCGGTGRIFVGECEHGVRDGDWCELCNLEYRRASEEFDHGIRDQE